MHPHSAETVKPPCRPCPRPTTTNGPASSSTPRPGPSQARKEEVPTGQSLSEGGRHGDTSGAGVGRLSDRSLIQGLECGGVKPSREGRRGMSTMGRWRARSGPRRQGKGGEGGVLCDAYMGVNGGDQHPKSCQKSRGQGCHAQAWMSGVDARGCQGKGRPEDGQGSTRRKAGSLNAREDT